MNTKTSDKSLRVYQIFFLILGIFSAAAIGTNLVIRRVPVHDANIESDLSSIAGAIDSYSSMQLRLPGALADVSGLSATTQKRLNDYDYTPGIGYSYQLCATFLATSSPNTRRQITPAPGYPDVSTHAKGRQCFLYTAQIFNNVPGVKPLPQPAR